MRMGGILLPISWKFLNYRATQATKLHEKTSCTNLFSHAIAGDFPLKSLEFLKETLIAEHPRAPLVIVATFSLVLLLLSGAPWGMI